MKGLVLLFTVDGTPYEFDVISARVAANHEPHVTEPARTLFVQARQNNDDGSWMNFVQDNTGQEYEFEIGFNDESTTHTGTIEIGHVPEWGGGLGEWFMFESEHPIIEGTWA